MSEIDAKIRTVLDKLEEDIDRVTETLEPLLKSESIDALSEESRAPSVPYALSAYALSSVLFAYLRSEGRDTAVVMPELARVKERLDRLSAAPAKSSEPAGEREQSPKPGKHTRFNDAGQPKRSKRGDSRRSK